MVTFVLLARPALLALGGGDPAAHRTHATFAADYEKEPGRAHAVRCRLELTESGWRAHPFGRQGSHVLTSMVAADCLPLVPAESAGVAGGGSVVIEPFDGAGGAGEVAGAVSIGG